MGTTNFLTKPKDFFKTEMHRKQLKAQYYSSKTLNPRQKNGR
jgi:hypothetical protein